MEIGVENGSGEAFVTEEECTSPVCTTPWRESKLPPATVLAGHGAPVRGYQSVGDEISPQILRDEKVCSSH